MDLRPGAVGRLLTDTGPRDLVDAVRAAHRGEQVLAVVGEGLSSAEVGARLSLSAVSVKAHLSRVLTKIGCENRVLAAIVAHEAGIVA